jgi:histidyl-tRNA synthetase
MAFLQPFALEGLSLHLNSIGDEQDRPAYLAYLRGQFQQRADALCGDCQRRAQENPLRVLDCKIPSCQEALEDLEPITSFLNPENRDHFDQVCQGLEDFGIRFSLNPKLVRGLDYYTKTTFELVGTHEGAQNAIMGGGRYDRLVQQLGGPDTPAFGWALGVDRLVSLLQQQQPLEERRVDLFVIADPPTGFLRHALLWQALRDKGWLVTYDSGFGSLKKQLKKANKARARYVAILGEQELKSQEITLKDLSNGQQWSLPVAQFLSHCLTQLNSATPTSGALQ